MSDRQWLRTLDEILSALDAIDRGSVTAYWDDATEHVPRREPISMRLISRSSIGIDQEHVFLVDGDAYDAWCEVDIVPPELWWDRTEEDPILKLKKTRWSKPSE